MIAHLRTLACAAAVLAAGTLDGQRAPKPCPNGADDDQFVSVGVTILIHPTRMAATVDSVLEAQGYTITSAPARLGAWGVEPRFTWLDGSEDEGWHGEQHPGVQLYVRTQARGDSVALSVGARALCKVPPVPDGPEDVGGMVELLSSTMIVGAVSQAMDSLEARGVDLTSPVPRTRVSVNVPDTVGRFTFGGRRDYEDPRLGSSIRFNHPNGTYADVFVWGGTRVTETCDAVCAVNAEADGFIASFPEFIRAGHYRAVELTRDEPLRPGADALWAAGRHLTLKADKDGQMQESHYYVWSFPGFMLKVRASYPPSAEGLRQVEEFAAELLTKIAT